MSSTDDVLLHELHDWLVDALDRNQILHPTDRERARQFVNRLAARAAGRENVVEAARLDAVKGVMALMHSIGTLHVEPDAIFPHGNGYSTWFIDAHNAVGTAPLSAEEILRRIDARSGR